VRLIPYLLLLTGFLIHPCGQAQHLRASLAQMQKMYSQSDRLHIVMRIEAFENASVKKPHYQQEADIKKEGSNYHYLFGTTEMLLNGRLMVMVDKAARTLMYQQRGTKAETQAFGPGAMNLDSLFRFYEDPQYLGRKGAADQYRVIQKKGPVDEIELDIHSTSGLLTRMQYHYRKGPVVVIHFLVFDPKPQFEAGQFDESKYVVAEAGKFKAAAPFRNYHLSQSQVK
jgi:hypothetical protein